MQRVERRDEVPVNVGRSRCELADATFHYRGVGHAPVTIPGISVRLTSNGFTVILVRRESYRVTLIVRSPFAMRDGIARAKRELDPPAIHVFPKTSYSWHDFHPLTTP